uniref:Uncharacterized protein n=1 Tax=Rhodosorus marinus TaxID=101924 RepID=A0A7S3E5B8_9RHOD
MDWQRSQIGFRSVRRVFSFIRTNNLNGFFIAAEKLIRQWLRSTFVSRLVRGLLNKRMINKEINCFLDACDFVCLSVRHFHIEFLLNSQKQFDVIETIKSEVLKSHILRDLVLGYLDL